MAGKTKQKNKIRHSVPASIEHGPLTHGEVSSVFMPRDRAQRPSFYITISVIDWCEFFGRKGGKKKDKKAEVAQFRNSRDQCKSRCLFSYTLECIILL